LDNHSPKIQELADKAEAFCANWIHHRPSPSLLVLIGEVRTGKAHTAKQIFHFANSMSAKAFDLGAWGSKKAPSAMFISWPEAAVQLGEKNREFIFDSFDADLLVIDDVGAENDPWKISADGFRQILSRREKKFTVITTNIAPAYWGERFDARSADRLMRNSTDCDLTNLPPYQSAE
jgi:DNA replication protein DnaC